MHKTKPSEKKVSDGIGAENQTTRACVPHTLYTWDLDFMQATLAIFKLVNPIPGI
ncbi:MAG: hypothetical protein Q4D78_07085 [Neisseria zoodegmatis]|uniref:hypothetical protein n=1 Tax=Neisseria zoodegmatis TaxID=326523 RepID=UPI0026F2724E|nr:hypothetical protein [Neisseria zoodegmatis]MDO5069947.1 hypothetical protein [Neisseria zoodegmatis]